MEARVPAQDFVDRVIALLETKIQTPRLSPNLTEGQTFLKCGECEVLERVKQVKVCQADSVADVIEKVISKSKMPIDKEPTVDNHMRMCFMEGRMSGMNLVLRAIDKLKC